MRRQGPWTVDPTATRPAGTPNTCFYCDQPIGGEHREGCVLRTRTVVVALTIDYVIEVPEHWTSQQIEASRNHAFGCSQNGLDELEEVVQRRSGNPDTPILTDRVHWCDHSRFVYIREATADDEHRDGVFVPQPVR